MGVSLLRNSNRVSDLSPPSNYFKCDQVNNKINNNVPVIKSVIKEQKSTKFAKCEGTATESVI